MVSSSVFIYCFVFVFFYRVFIFYNMYTGISQHQQISPRHTHTLSPLLVFMGTIHMVHLALSSFQILRPVSHPTSRCQSTTLNNFWPFCNWVSLFFSPGKVIYCVVTLSSFASMNSKLIQYNDFLPLPLPTASRMIIQKFMNRDRKSVAGSQKVRREAW